MSIRLSLVHILLSIQIISCGSSPLGAQGSRTLRYTVTDLSSAGEIGSTAKAINSKGEVVGISRDAGFIERVFLYTGSRVQYIRTLAGSDVFSDSSSPLGINDYGDIVGHTNSIGSFLYRSGDLRILDGNAFSINNSGQVVGMAYGRAFIYTEQDGVKDLGIPQVSGATAINSFGDITGFYRTKIGNDPPSPSRPFLNYDC